MGKCTCPKHKAAAAASKKKAAATKAKGSSKNGCTGKRKGHPANMFIIYFLQTWRKNGGNMYCVAKECGKKWATLSDKEKEKYKRIYCAKCKNCKSCQKKQAKDKKKC